MTSEQIRQTRLGNSTAKAVLSYLAGRAMGSDGPEGWAFPTKQRIAEDTELALRQVQRVMQVFELIGLVRPAEHSGKRGFLVAVAMLGLDRRQAFSTEYERLQNPGTRRRSVCQTSTELGNVCETPSTAAQDVCETPQSVCETYLGVCETFPPHPLIGVRTIEEPLKNQAAPAVLFETPLAEAKVVTLPARPDKDYAEECYQLYREQGKAERRDVGNKAPAITCILNAIRDLRAEGLANPGAVLLERVQTWLKWRAKRYRQAQEAGSFLSNLQNAKTWFGKNERGWESDEAQPVAPSQLRSNDGTILNQEVLKKQGWTIAEVA